ncbi:ATP-dependent nuclease [Methylobacterium sp. A52T]
MDIRPSDIAALTEKVKKRSFAHYLMEIKLANVRAFKGQKITLDFPVTAIIGTNGGGKSTILGAAALAYKAVKPGDFFPKSNVSDNSMADWRIEYELIDRSVDKSGTIARNARFVSAKWRREYLIDRDVVVVPIQRTVPASEQPRYKRFIGIYKEEGAVIEELSSDIRRRAGAVLGKNLKGYSVAKLKKEDNVYLMLGMQNENDYSQFHFGAGEASVIEMISSIEQAPDQALILIEEIENGLHPVATEKMTEYLIDVAKRKKSQIIFTTHSEYALKKLPPNAIWACIDGQAYQGKLSIDSLRAIKGLVEKQIAVFVEDDFAKDLLEEALRQIDSRLLDAAEVHKAGGYPFLIEVMQHHNKNPTVKIKAIAVVDGDQAEFQDETNSTYVLPGSTPELSVFNYINENVESLASVLQQRCLCPQVSQDKIVKIFEKIDISTSDVHLYFSKIGQEMGFISELTVRKACISIYVENNKEHFDGIIQALRRRLEQG